MSHIDREYQNNFLQNIRDCSDVKKQKFEVRNLQSDTSASHSIRHRYYGWCSRWLIQARWCSPPILLMLWVIIGTKHFMTTGIVWEASPAHRDPLPGHGAAWLPSGSPQAPHL